MENLFANFAWASFVQKCVYIYNTHWFRVQTVWAFWFIRIAMLIHLLRSGHFQNKLDSISFSLLIAKLKKAGKMYFSVETNHLQWNLSFFYYAMLVLALDMQILRLFTPVSLVVYGIAKATSRIFWPEVLTKQTII